jgi:hypothetical protein
LIEANDHLAQEENGIERSKKDSVLAAVAQW